MNKEQKTDSVVELKVKNFQVGIVIMIYNLGIATWSYCEGHYLWTAILSFAAGFTLPLIITQYQSYQLKNNSK